MPEAEAFPTSLLREYTTTTTLTLPSLQSVIQSQPPINMDWDECAEASHRAESLSWARKFNEARGPPLAAWVSTFRNNLPCEVVGDDCGSFNWSCKVRFNDGVQWMVRLAVPGRVMKGDKKIAREVATMQFVKKETSIPIPSIIAWGLGDQNPLGLGPFIIMEFIEGEPLDTILRQYSPPGETSVLRADIGDTELRVLYRQIANILLDLARHDFPQIGSLSNPSDTSDHITSPPLTLKMNEIESHGGVDTSGMSVCPFMCLSRL